MGMLQGKAIDDTFIVVDSFALPVEGTETRVNAAEGAYEYLATYPETAKVFSFFFDHVLFLGCC
jgi:COP9 signalosome complex subunit 5